MVAGSPISLQRQPPAPLTRWAAPAAARLRRLRRTNAAVALGCAIGAVLIFLAIFGPFIWPPTVAGIALGQSLHAPSWAHPMGTDQLGRDLFARFDEGARISLASGAAVSVGGAVVGGAIGIVSGLLRGLPDAVLMRAIDMLLAFPPLILAMAVSLGLGEGVVPASIGLFLVSLPWYARLVRGEVIRLSVLPFIESTVLAGATRWALVRRHILPHLLPMLLIQVGAVFGYTILSLAALSFVGLGAQIPTPEWGALIAEGFQYSLTGQWWLGVFPGLGLLAAVVAASVLTDSARDVFDPRGSTEFQ